MFTGHIPELLIVAALAMVFFGPKRLPELGSALGSGIKEFRRATSELRADITGDPVRLPAQRLDQTGAGDGDAPDLMHHTDRV